MEPSPDSPAPVDVAPAPAPARRDLYLAWTGFQRRAVSMQEILGFDLHHLPPLQESRWLRPLDYLAQARDTVKLVRSGAYDTIWVQTPPTFLVHLLLALRSRTPFRLITDCHHGALLPPWSRIPGAISLLNRCDVVLMHNSETLEQAAGMGVNRDRMVVLEDPPPPDFRAGAGAPGVVPEGPYVLVPCSFKYDEPIPMLMETARAMPELRFLVTGSLKRAEAQGFTAGPPGNVTFTGFLDLADYDALLANATVVLGLTTEEGVQLSVANEALGAGRALVLSDTRVLRAMFGAAALLSANTPAALADTLRTACARREQLQEASRALRDQRLAAWSGLIPDIRGALPAA
jgi:glycosyltransferase involved in cell wall biosynthesis